MAEEKLVVRTSGRIRAQSSNSVNPSLHLPLSDMIVLKQLHAASVNGDKNTIHKLCTGHPHCTDMSDNRGRTSLMLAIITNRVECVRSLIRFNSNHRISDNTSRTALHWAAFKGNVECVQILLSAGAECGVKDAEGHTPLHLATRHSSIKCLALIIKYLQPGEVDIQDNEKRIALHWSALYGHASHVRLLIRSGSNIGVPDINGQSPLHCAASVMRSGTVSCVKMLLGECEGVINWPDEDGQTVLHLSITTGQTQLITVLTQHRCNVNALDNMFRTPLHWAAALGFSDITDLLLSTDADPSSSDMNGATPLHYAAKKNHTDVVKVLLSHEGLVDEHDHEGRSAFLWAAAAGSDDVINVFLDNDVDVTQTDKHGHIALDIAAASGHLSTTLLLLNHLPSLSSSLSFRFQALILASKHGHNHIIDMLIREGEVDKSVCDEKGLTPLHWSCLMGHRSTTQLLLSLGFPFDCVDEDGRMALHCAAWRSQTACVILLLESSGPNGVDSADDNGMTPLHWAGLAGSLEVVHALVERGAYLNHVTYDEERLTPLDCALSREHEDISEYLIMRGGITSSAIKALAATKIQSVYRGHLMRKAFLEQKGLLLLHEQLKKVVSRRKSQDSIQLARGQGNGRYHDPTTVSTPTISTIISTSTTTNSIPSTAPNPSLSTIDSVTTSTNASTTIKTELSKPA